jgi:D-alanyl-D-alanine carboxypeptidase/D-alanyl-D-alanine-endopeptidase (penicillin-binding protein 4)
MEDPTAMKRPTVYPPFAAALLLFATSLPAHAESLDSKINALLASDLVKGASISLNVVEVGANGARSTELYAHNATLPLGPASNCKLLTTAAAFETYGPKAAFKTYLYQVGEDLVIVGGGDPALGDAKLAQESNTSITAPFERWAASLQHANITHYRNLIVDDRVFDNDWIHPNWPAKDAMDWYSAPIGGLSFNCNCLDWLPTVSGKSVGIQLFPNTSYVDISIKATRGAETRVSLIRPAASNHFELRGTVAPNAGSGAPGEPFSVPIYDPGLWTGTILKDVLASKGIAATGDVRRVAPDEHLGNGTLVASNETPLLSVIGRANKNSINMMAESLCKRLGHDATGKPGSWASGTAAVTAYATHLGVDPSWLSLDDGSGLSSKNRVAAKAFTTVLAHVAQIPDGHFFVESLAIPGEDGTLKKRFKGMGVSAAVHAKTGHITGVSTLSGYIQVSGKSGNDRLFAFSILCNKYQGNVNPWQDQVCEAIYTWALQK